MADLKARFGKLVAENRKRLGLTQHELAQHAGLSVDTVKRLESGRVGASFEAVERLSAALHLEPDRLFVSAVETEGVRKALVELTDELSQMSDRELFWVKQMIELLRQRP